MVLNDFMRGKIPWFTPAPRPEEDSDDVLGDSAGTATTIHGQGSQVLGESQSSINSDDANGAMLDGVDSEHNVP